MTELPGALHCLQSFKFLKRFEIDSTLSIKMCVIFYKFERVETLLLERTSVKQFINVVVTGYTYYVLKLS